jgi:hypothetical protein
VSAQDVDSLLADLDHVVVTCSGGAELIMGLLNRHVGVVIGFVLRILIDVGLFVLSQRAAESLGAVGPGGGLGKALAVQQLFGGRTSGLVRE